MAEVRPGTADTIPVPSPPEMLPGLRLSRDKTRGAVWPDQGNDNINHTDQGDDVWLSGQPAKHLCRAFILGPQPRGSNQCGFRVCYWEWDPSQGGHLPVDGLPDLERPAAIPVDLVL